MSDAQLFAWMFWGAVLCLALSIGLLVFDFRLHRKQRRLLAEAARQVGAFMPEMVLLVEDIMRIEPEREEALSVARLDLIAKQDEMQTLVAGLERKRWLF